MKQIIASFWVRHPKAAEQLKGLWLQGYSASYILAEIGGTGEISRNAVIGKAHRMGLPRHDRAENRQPAHNGAEARPKKKRRLRILPELLPEKPIRIVEVVNMDGFMSDLPKEKSKTAVSLFDAQAHHCRWPLGEAKDMMFCGETVVPDGKLCFCLAHYRRAISRTGVSSGYTPFTRFR